MNTPKHKSLAWLMGSLLASITNDALAKYATRDTAIATLTPWEVTFLRLLGTTLWIGGYLICRPQAAYTPYRALHLLRGTMLIGAMGLWHHGLQGPLTDATIVSAIIPLLVFGLAVLCLKEQTSRHLSLLMLWGGLGTVALLLWHADHPQATCSLLLAALLFALLDVLNKYYIHKEGIIAMIFYPTLVALLLAAPAALHTPHLFTYTHFLFALALGIGGHTIIFCLLKAYRAASATSLAPLRWLELLFSMAVAQCLFHESPGQKLWLLPFTLPAVWFTHHQQQRRTKGITPAP